MEGFITGLQQAEKVLGVLFLFLCSYWFYQASFGKDHHGAITFVGFSCMLLGILLLLCGYSFKRSKLAITLSHGFLVTLSTAIYIFLFTGLIK